MINIENIVYNTVATAVRNEYGVQYPDLTCYSEYVDAPSGFPCVSLYESNNTTLDRTLTDACEEHHAQVTYDINVYCNNGSERKALCKQIADTVDTAMLGMKFRRTMSMVTPNLDRTIYRMTMRYTAIVEKPKVINDVTTYQMYRR